MDLILLDQHDAVWHLQLNRPQKANAYTETMLALMEEAITEFNQDSQAQVLILSGYGGSHFCAGADINEVSVRGYEAGLNLKSANCFNYIANSSKITLASINGAAVGGGMELALACDLRVCSETTTFKLPEMDHGLIPAAGGIYRLPQIVGLAKAKELVLGGVQWNATEAYRFGLVSRVLAPEDLLEFSLRWANEIASKNSLTLRLAKQAINIDARNSHGFALSCVSEALLYELNLKQKADKALR